MLHVQGVVYCLDLSILARPCLVRAARSILRSVQSRQMNIACPAWQFACRVCHTGCLVCRQHLSVTNICNIATAAQGLLHLYM